ncbi:MAG: hypothetical protein M3253_02255, partial [Chloroflexota bacterium]|nr:hypothetical protein [Chloroflexota bacterium]
MNGRPGNNRTEGAGGLSPLLLLLAGGLLLRFAIAYVLLPGSGFRTDIGTFTAWALTLAEHGPGQFYDVTSFADYPPGYLYVLWLVGGLAHLIAPLVGSAPSLVAGTLIKVPPMLADVGVGLVLYLLVSRWAAGRTDGRRLGLLAAGIYLFNPVTWYDSAVWGQTDAVGALVILLGVAALVRGNSEGAAALAVLAAVVKPQFGVVFAPLVGVILLRRHLLAAGSGPRHRPLVPPALRAWFEEERGWWRILSSAVVGFFVLYALILPFSLDLPRFVERMVQAAGGYDGLSVNAYNLWALVGSDGRQPLAFGGGWSPDTVPLLGPIPGVAIGALLLAAGFLVGLLRVAWRDDRRSIIAVAIFLALCFFVLPTRVHERYLFPAFALLPLLAVVDRRWLWATIALSVASFINLHGILTIELYATPNLVGLPFGELFREPLAVIASALLHTAVFAFVAWRLRPAAAVQRDPGAAASLAPREPLPTPAAPVALVGDWSAAMGRNLRRLTGVVPLRRDRSAELIGERGGRLGRLDLLLIVVVLLSTLGLRTYRLNEPYSMHFDEVYHARTAVEFLQHWRYGYRDGIYEYTHPHLAKYIMAGGVALLGDNRVVSEGQLAGPVRAVAVEAGWNPRDAPGERNGDRLFVAGGGSVRVHQLSDLRHSATIELDASALAVDEANHTLYLADGAGGIWQLPTTQLDAQQSSPEPVEGISPEPLVELPALAGDLQRLVVTGGRLVAITDAGMLLSLDPSTGAEDGRTTVPGAVDAVAVTADGEDLLAVAASSGFVLLDRSTLDELSAFETSQPISGMALLTDGVEQPTLYGAAGDRLERLELRTEEEPRLQSAVQMPNAVENVLWNPATTLIHVPGRQRGGEQPTVYVVEPRSNAVFADAGLPFEPRAVVLDTQPLRPAEDRAQLLAFDGEGSAATVN